MVYCVGLTGPVASGKTTVAALFNNFGIDVIYADQISKEISSKGTLAFDAIVNHFGHSIQFADGSLDRKKLRDIIFTNSDEKKWLEELLHPLIRQEIEKKIAQSQSPYCLIEIPLLIDKKNYPYLNQILVVVTNKENQLIRAQKRDNSSYHQARAIVSSQNAASEYLAIADDVIENNGDIDFIKHKVKALHQKYTNTAHNSLLSQD